MKFFSTLKTLTALAVLSVASVAGAQITFAADAVLAKDASGDNVFNADGLSTGIYDDDLIIGDPNAPVTMVEYASLTCGHCGSFHTGSYKKLEKDFIETGQVRLILRDMPWDGLAFSAALVARCHPAEKQAALYKLFLENQAKWTRGGPEALYDLVKVAGVSEEKAKACIDDEDMQAKILERRQVGIDELGVSGTPYFFVNGRHLQNTSWREMKRRIEGAL